MLLQRRGTVYYLRTRIPADLRDLIGRAEIKRTLRTTSRRDAKKFCRLNAAGIERIFTQLRFGREAMNENQLKRFADKLLADFIGKVEKNRQVGTEAFGIPPMELPEGYMGDGFSALDSTLSRQRNAHDLNQVAAYHKQQIVELREELRFGRYSGQTREIARRRVQYEHLKIELPPETWFMPTWLTSAELPDGVVSTWDEQPSADFATICRTVAQTLLECHEIELERVSGIYSTDRQLKAEDRLMSAARCFTLNDLWNSYRSHKTTGEEWAETTLEKYKGFVHALNKILGTDHDFFVYEDVDQVTDLIQQLRRYKSARTGQTWSTSSVNDCIVFLSTLHRYAIRNRKFGVSFNPFEGRQVAETDTKKREAFTAEELAGIWRGLQRLKGKPGKVDRYWTVLIMLYTGCRIGEVCQLRLDDFEKIGDHWLVHFRSRPELGQSIKGEKLKKKKRPNEAVDRITPIHPHLRQLGLFRYIDHLKEKGEKQLFPGEKRTAGRSGVLMAKKVKTFVQQCLGKDAEKSAHHCRHTMITWFKQNVDLTHTAASLISAMVGHEDETINGSNRITWGTYGGAHTFNQMLSLIKKLDYGFPLKTSQGGGS